MIFSFVFSLVAALVVVFGSISRKASRPHKPIDENASRMRLRLLLGDYDRRCAQKRAFLWILSKGYNCLRSRLFPYAWFRLERLRLAIRRARRSRQRGLMFNPGVRVAIAVVCPCAALQLWSLCLLVLHLSVRLCCVCCVICGADVQYRF